MVSEKGFQAFLKTYTTNSEKETRELGEKIGKKLTPGTVVALEGEVGAGKTVFIKGLSRGLGVKNPAEVKSPTFVLLHIYEGRYLIHHFDLYRLEDEKSLDDIGFEDFLANPQSVALVEWADRAEKKIPHGSLWIEIEPTGENSRRIKISEK